MRWQDLPLSEKLAHEEPVQSVTKEQKMARIRHINKFYEDKI